MDREPSCAGSLEGREGVSTASTLMATLYLHQALEIWTCEEKVRWKGRETFEENQALCQRDCNVDSGRPRGATRSCIWSNDLPVVFLVFPSFYLEAAILNMRSAISSFSSSLHKPA